MNQCSQPHAVSESTPLHTFKNNPLRLEIPAKAMNPTSTPDYLSPLSADGNESNLDHITCLERSLCSDFFCCGGRLPDLHALLEHFEEEHVMILAPNGKRVYPRDGLRSVPQHKAHSVLTTPSPSSSRSSSVAPSSTPPTPSDFVSPTSGPFASRKSNLTALPPVYTPFTPGLPVDPADPYLDADEIVMQHDPRIYGYSDENYPITVLAPLESTTSSSSSCDEDEEMSDSSAIDTPASPGQPIAIAAIQKQVKFVPTRGRPSSKYLETLLSSPSLSKTKIKNRHSTSGSILSPSRRREKSFRCPTPRCTKSYLNPNGLKYHMEKGTCKIEGEDEGDGEHSESISSAGAGAASTASNAKHVLSSVGSNTYPRIHPQQGPTQDVEMIMESQSKPIGSTTASDALGTRYLNSTTFTVPVPTTELHKTDIELDIIPDEYEDIDLDLEVDTAAVAAPSCGSLDRNSVAEVEITSSDPSQMLEQQRQKMNFTHGHAPYYRSSSSNLMDVCAASPSASSSMPMSRPYSYITPSTSPKPKVNSKGKGKGKEQRRRVVPSHKPDTDPQSRVSTPVSMSVSVATTPTPRPSQQQHTQQHQQPVVYHYPVPSYPQLGGGRPIQGYHGFTTTIHRPYYVNDTAAAVATPSDHHPLLFSPIPVQLVGASNSARLR